MVNVLCCLLVSCVLIVPYSVHGESLTAQRNYFLQAEDAIDKGKFDVFEELSPSIKDYPLYPFLLYKKLSKTPGRIDQVTSFVEEYSETRYPTLLRWDLLKYLAAEKRWSDYIFHYQKTVRPELQCHYYWALYQTGHKQEALEGARTLWLAGRSLPKACDGLFEKFQNSALFKPELVWQRFELSMRNGNAGLAKYLKRFIPNDEKHLADFWLDIHRNPRMILSCGQWNREIERMTPIFVYGIDRLSRIDPGLARDVWALRKEKFNIRKEVKGYLESRLGIALATRRDPSSAKFLADVDLELADSSLKEWRIRDALIRLDWQASLQSVNQLGEPARSLPGWRYWRARSLENLGNQVEAQAIYAEVAKERSFYGFLAADKLNVEYSWSDQPIEVDHSEIRKFAEKRSIRAVREFRHFGRESLAQREWWHIVRQLDHREILVAAKLAQKWGWNQVAIFTVAKAEYWDDLELRFPLLFRRMIENHASETGLRPSLIYGVMRQESAFDQTANSPAGARGLMQIMPATGRQIARSLKEKWKSSRVLYEADINVRYGTTYLKKLLSQFEHNFPLAIASYNAGEHRIANWLPFDEALPADIWIENIPFKETRHYVMTVLAYSAIYHQRLEKKLLRLSSLLNKVRPSKRVRAVSKDIPELLPCNK